jgi:murein DD-endopeptidase MepM/ murein hydrolase activator NlpD
MTNDNLTTFALLGAGGAFATAAFASQHTPSKERNISPPLPVAGLHVVPLPVFGEYAPTISNEWNPRRGHLGVDLMYARKSRADQLAAYPVNTPNGARDFFVPEGTLVLAAAEGVVRVADRTPRGWSVIIDHADGTSTYYTHLETLSVTRTSRSKSAQRVTTGQPLGVVGFDPLDAEKLKHLHFELWLGRSRRLATDPALYIAQWSRVRVTSRGNEKPDEQLLPR